MVASVLIHEDGRRVVEETLRPELLAGGAEPEQRVVFCGISWDRYLSFDQSLGDDRPGPRIYFLDGELEIMTTSNEHERVKKWIGGLLELYFDAIGIEIMPRGQATMRLALKAAGAEPDESWCLGEEKEFPDLVLEIALTSGGIDKLKIYRRFNVPEVWIWRRGKLEIFARSGAAGYAASATSLALPGLDIALLERCVHISSWRQARQAFRAGLK